MLTKIELTQKRDKTSQQLDLVETISKDDVVRKKRLFVVVAIIATIGLSLIFSIYRYFKTVKLSPPKLPEFSAVQINPESIDSQISQIPNFDKSKWQIDYNSKLADAAKLKVSTSSLIKDVLPEGLVIKENYQSTSTDQTFSVLILVPNNEIFINLKYGSTDPDVFKSTLKKIVPIIYWSKVQSK